MSDGPLSCPSLFNMRSCPDVFTYRYIAMNLKHAAIGRPLGTCSFHVCPHEQATPLAVSCWGAPPFNTLGLRECWTKKLCVVCLGTKATWALALGPEEQAAWEDLLVTRNSPTRFFKGSCGWVLGVASLLSRVNYFLSSWENKNSSGFLFAEIIHRWLLGFVS